MPVENFCRLCAVEFPLSSLKNVKELQNDHLDSLILKYLQIKINDKSEFPTTACKPCCKTVLNFHKFLLEVKHAQEKLRDIISNYVSNIKLENNDHNRGDSVKTEIDDSNLISKNYKCINDSEVDLKVKNELDLGTRSRLQISF